MKNFKKHLPTREQLKNTRSLRFLGDHILDPNLWHFNRYSLSFAFLVGGFCTFLPVPFQSIPCVLLCIWIRCNIPVAVVVVWISNPITMGPMMYFAYRVGGRLLQQAPEYSPLDPSFEWFMNQLSDIWQPLIVGCLFCGLVTGVTGFVAVRVYYRWRIHRYKLRKLGERATRI